MKRKKIALLLALCLAFCLSGCTPDAPADSPSDGQTPVEPSTIHNAASPDAVSDGDFDLSFSEKDRDASYDSGSPRITFAGETVSSNSSAVQIDGSTATVTRGGVYIVTGQSDAGRLHIKAPDSEDVRLVLDGLTLKNTVSPLTAESADKVILTLAEDSQNSFEDGGSSALTVDGSSADGAIFVKTDLTINGSGSLNVTGAYKHGIVSKDDFVLTGGSVSIRAKNVGIEGKDSIRIQGGVLTVDAGTDGLRADNTEESDRGFLYIAGGDIRITAGNDGMQAVTLLRVDEGTVAVTSGGGSASAPVHTETGRPFDRGFSAGNFDSSSDQADAESSKGLKAGSTVALRGGSFVLDCCDDAIHSNNEVLIEAGDYTIRTGDDGIHADALLTVNGGALTIEQSFEGLEATDLRLNGGTIRLTASDDGVNAAGGNDADAGFDPFARESGGTLTIAGGYLTVHADGDGLDANGSIAMSGGVVLVNGPQDSANAALDYESSATVTGGILIAVGSSGMAQSVTGSGQGSICTNIDTQQGGVPLSLVDSTGTVLAAFTPERSYTNVVFCAPGIAAGETYSILCGGTLSDVDDFGFASSGTVDAGTQVQTVTMTTENYSSAAFGGMGGRGGMGGGMRGPNGAGGMQEPNGGGFVGM